jgi:hypothetical protein
MHAMLSGGGDALTHAVPLEIQRWRWLMATTCMRRRRPIGCTARTCVQLLERCYEHARPLERAT